VSTLESGRGPRWMSVTLWLAAVYNIVWGGWVVLFPLSFFQWLALPPPNYPQIWQCLGMVVGVYGIGYACAAPHPLRHWPIVLVGLLGKLCGPLGFLVAVSKGELPWRFGFLLLANDLIWWVPFALILYRTFEEARRRD
jgi:small multidrug resistance pump